jgi:hypothetical protein
VASQAAIDSVKVQLPDLTASFGITDEIISAQIDAVGQTKTILFGLRAMAAKVAAIEDVEESGSSRRIQFHERLMAMIADWQTRADAEDAATGLLPPKMPGKTHTVVRV